MGVVLNGGWFPYSGEHRVERIKNSNGGEVLYDANGGCS